ncbi:hypothetical protein T07_5301 [Trichinella nelsoni]|uniref:Uncharacterized protein n=1 Tax=Trichinella nelsoni TaxID=6336 RepID=A0A0V0RE67_9BILA|nr:hypothetical protein T07_5301 [Trichinella nelsoni]
MLSSSVSSFCPVQGRIGIYPIDCSFQISLSFHKILCVQTHNLGAAISVQDFPEKGSSLVNGSTAISVYVNEYLLVISLG